MLFSHRNGRKKRTRNNIHNKCYCKKERKTRRNNIRCTFENVIDDFLRVSRFSFSLPFVCNLRAEEKIGNNSNFSKVFLFRKERRQTIKESFTPLHISSRKPIAFETKRNTTNINFPCGRITHSFALRPKCLFAVCVNINIIRPSFSRPSTSTHTCTHGVYVSVCSN